MSVNQRQPLRQSEAAPELALAMACCAWPQSDEALGRVRALAASVSQWKRFRHVVKVHRIAPLAHHTLALSGASIPPEIADDLRVKAMQAARFDLRLAAESIRLQQAFVDAGLAMMILKGVGIGMLAYGRLGMKMSLDIDILVDGGELRRVRGVLAGAGYHALLDEKQAEAMGDLAHEFTFRHANGIELDVHTALCPNPRMFAGIDAHGPAQSVKLPGGDIRMLADGTLFSFLSYHGAVHHWSRLKWLADFNAFAAARVAQLDELLDAAEQYGVGRSGSNALLLCEELLGSVWPAEVRERLDHGRVARALRAAVVSAPAFTGLSATRPLRSSLLHFGLERGSDHALSHLRLRWLSAVDRAALRLPRGLGFVYHLVRIPLALSRAMQRRYEASRRQALGSGSD